MVVLGLNEIILRPKYSMPRGTLCMSSSIIAASEKLNFNEYFQWIVIDMGTLPGYVQTYQILL